MSTMWAYLSLKNYSFQSRNQTPVEHLRWSFFAKISIVDVPLGSKYASGLSLCFFRFFHQVFQRSPDEPIRSQCTLSLPPEYIRKAYGFLMFSGDRERVHWERMS